LFLLKSNRGKDSFPNKLIVALIQPLAMTCSNHASPAQWLKHKLLFQVVCLILSFKITSTRTRSHPLSIWGGMLYFFLLRFRNGFCSKFCTFYSNISVLKEKRVLRIIQNVPPFSLRARKFLVFLLYGRTFCFFLFSIFFFVK
jgi:hypothetical protein